MTPISVDVTSKPPEAWTEAELLQLLDDIQRVEFRAGINEENKLEAVFKHIPAELCPRLILLIQSESFLTSSVCEGRATFLHDTWTAFKGRDGMPDPIPTLDKVKTTVRDDFHKQITMLASLTRCPGCRQLCTPQQLHSETGHCLHPPVLVSDYRSVNHNPDVFGSRAVSKKCGEHWELCCADIAMLKKADDSYITNFVCHCDGTAHPDRIIRRKVFVTTSPLFPDWKPSDRQPNFILIERITGCVCNKCGCTYQRLDIPTD